MDTDEPYYCIACKVFKEHGYDDFFMTHTCMNIVMDDSQGDRTCQECGTTLKEDEFTGETTCPKCGLVHSGPYPYTAGFRIDYPYGTRV